MSCAPKYRGYQWRLISNQHKQKGDKSYEDEVELAQEEVQEEEWLCGGIAGCAGVCDEE